MEWTTKTREITIEKNAESKIDHIRGFILITRKVKYNVDCATLYF